MIASIGQLVTRCKSFMRSARWDQAGEIVDQLAILAAEKRPSTIRSDNTETLVNALAKLDSAVDVVTKLREALLLCRPEHVTRGAIALADEFLGSVK